MSNKLLEVSTIMGDALRGDYAAQGRVKAIASGSASLSEAFSSSDLAATFTAVTNQALLAQYADLPSTWGDFAKREVLPDFLPQYFRELSFQQDTNLALNGGIITAPNSLPNVPELSEYPTFGWSTSANAVQVRKKGARAGFSWEMVINDQWNLISSIPGQLARFARNTEETSAYSVLASVTGPNATTFNAGNLNVASTDAVLAGKNYALNLDSLILAKVAVRRRKHNNNFITVPKFRLIVPTAMEETARRLLNIQTIEMVVGTGSNQVRYVTGTNFGDVTLTVSDWLTRIDKSANSDKTWYLVPDKGFDGTRTSIALAFLQNNETPEFRQSGNTGQYLGGGGVPSMQGSLVNDEVQYRVRHVVDGGLLWPQALFASTGVDGAAPQQAIVA
jgi:hypothetical protein